ncbi:MAG: SusC/RagA family TonB-linked outer membrane protein [Bacteroidales bacterium]
MCQQKKKCSSYTAISGCLIGGALFLASGSVYAAADHNGRIESAIVAQTGRTISGIVLDEKGESIIGANIRVKNSQIGTITDIDGRFILNHVPSGSVLQISYIGYKDQDVKVGEKSDLTIKMQEDTKLIDEVVVVGYASQKKENLSGSVSSVDMSGISEKRPITNLSSGLAGMAAGVSVTSSSNKPGDDNSSILVRGQGTLNNSAPLVIIDGVESNINSVSPQDVESMTVLKDAASASIYGSRAANGVILITTKKGKSGKVNIDYTGYVSLESIGKTVDAVSDYATYMELMNEAYTNSGQPARFTDKTISEWRNDGGRNPLLYPNTNWVDEVFRTAVATNHNISLSGGSDKISFYTSFGYNMNPGVMENSGYERYSFRSNVEAKVTSWLTLGAKLNGYLANTDLGQDKVGDVFTYGVASTPGIVLRHPDGRYGGQQNPEDDMQANNPLLSLYKEVGGKKERNMRAQFNGTIDICKGLSVYGSYSYEFTDKDNWKKTNLTDTWNFNTESIVQKDSRRNYIYSYNRKIERMFMDGVIRYENRFLKDKFDLKAMLGASQEMRRDRSFDSKKYDWVDPSVDVINGATGEAVATGSHAEWAMHSYFGRVNMGWANKYLLEMNLRADASSRFLKNKRWGYFPSFSGAWRVDQESFMRNTRNWLDGLKFRASWGKLGNNYLSSDYMAIPTYAQANYVLNGGMVIGMAQTALANGNLTWESTAVTNVGVDFNVLDNRLSGTAEYFYKKTSDILIDLPAPLVHGSSSVPTQNSAEVLNKGFELSLNWSDKIKDFRYNVGLNMTFIDNKVTKFKGDEMSINGSTMIKEGYAINTQYILVADRIIQNQSDLDYVQSLIDNAPVVDGKPVNPFQTYKRPEMGDVLYKDTDGNGIFNDDDRVPLGYGDTPRFLYNITLGVEYKGFDLSTVLSGTGSYKVQYQTMHSSSLAYGNQISREIADGRWFEGRTDAIYPRLLTGDGRNTRSSTLWETNKSYFKIRNIQLGYTLPLRWSKAASLNRVRVFCSLENFFTFTNYAGMDPETDKISYPTMRQASFGLNVTF